MKDCWQAGGGQANKGQVGKSSKGGGRGRGRGKGSKGVGGLDTEEHEPEAGGRCVECCCCCFQMRCSATGSHERHTCNLCDSDLEANKEKRT